MESLCGPIRTHPDLHYWRRCVLILCQPSNNLVITHTVHVQLPLLELPWALLTILCFSFFHVISKCVHYMQRVFLTASYSGF